MDKKGTAKLILKFLLISGVLTATIVAPKFGLEVMKIMDKNHFLNGRPNRENKKMFFNAFYYLRKKGLLHIEYRKRQMYVSLTPEGKRRAGKYQIDDLKIKTAKKWDKIWRILIFDIQDKQRIKREALRGKIKELGLCQIQKSVWVYPYDFKKEMILLREFFGLTNAEMKLITASEIENDELIKDFFKLN